MQPQDPYQYQKPDTSLPPVDTTTQGNWSPVGNTPLQPSPDPRAKRMKIVLISFGVIMTLLVIVAVIAATRGDDQPAAQQQEYIAGPETDVPLTEQDVAKFSMRYPSSLNLAENQELPEENGWFLLLSEEDIENSAYELIVKVSNVEPDYVDGEEAVFEINPVEADPYNLQVSDVVTAGTRAKKTTAEFMNGGVPYVVAYSMVRVGDRYVEVSALYPKDQEEIVRSFDAMIGSIRLKD